MKTGYIAVPNYSWEFWPPPYNFLAPPSVLAKPGQVQPQDLMQISPTGLGCTGGACNCGGACKGLGQAGLFGTGLFESLDTSTWGWGEWASIAVGGYLVIKLFLDAQTAGAATKRTYRRVRKSMA